MISFHIKSIYVLAHLNQSDPEHKRQRSRQSYSQHPGLRILIGQIPFDLLQCLLVNRMVVWVIRGKDGFTGDVLQVTVPGALGDVLATDGILTDDVGVCAAVLVDNFPVFLLRDIHLYVIKASHRSRLNCRPKDRRLPRPKSEIWTPRM